MLLLFRLASFVGGLFGPSISTGALLLCLVIVFPCEFFIIIYDCNSGPFVFCNAPCPQVKLSVLNSSRQKALFLVGDNANYSSAVVTV